MEYRILGRSGLRVSEISLGCWAIGGPSWRDGNPVGWSGNDDAQSLAGLRRAFELGTNHFDSADVYGDGHSERIIGQFLKEVPRDQVIIATKVGYFRGTAPHAMAPLHMRHQLEQSLENFGTDYIDLHYFHNTNFGHNDRYLHDSAAMMQRFKQEGKIRHVGQSAHSLDAFKHVGWVTQADVLQLPYNALGSGFDKPEGDVFGWAAENNLGMVLFGNLAKGLLLDKFDPDNPPQRGEGDIRADNPGFTREGLLKMRERLQPIKARFGSSVEDLSRVALQFCLARSPLACVIPGFKNPHQVEINAKASGRPLSADDVAFVRQALQG